MSLRNLLMRSLVRRSKLKALPLVAAERQYHQYDYSDRWRYGLYTSYALFGAVLVGSTISDKKDDPTKKKSENLIEAGEKRPELPTYRADEVSKHDNKGSFWVTYRHGVYDVTSFLPSHPGGEQILNAGGLSVEPFWNVYGMHKTQQVYKLLESYRIGNLHDDDVCEPEGEELWAREPRRDPRLLVKSARPFNAETPPEHLVEHFNTPNDLFFVRQHMPVPELDERTHTVRVTVEASDGTASTTLFTMDELASMPQSEVNAALMCAGNRRTEMNEVKQVKGLEWGAGAVGNAQWRGVLLRDVLLRCGVRDDPADERHVILTGADMDATGAQFNTSVPLRRALQPGARVLLATRMNGAPLPRDHGRPVRALVPGAPAVRSVKWLESITVSARESDSHWHRRDYRSLGPSATWESADWERAPPLYSLPVTAAACAPRAGDAVRVRDGHVQVEGYAFSGGGARVVRVDVSGDGGASWSPAALRTHHAPAGEHYAWALWSVRLRAPHAHQMEIWVKATDSNFNTQPEKFNDIWNIRGVLANAYHKIKIKLIH